jgi:hypothetical protein
MDSKGFRIKGNPDFVRQPPYWLMENEVERVLQGTESFPSPDSRFSAYAAPMADGRLVTDYRQRCVTRAPPGTQFATKQWTIHNTDEIARLSRFRQVQNTGQALGTANTELPPKVLQSCTPYECKMTAGSDIGIGIERTDKAPPLFGTFTFPPDAATLASNKTHTQLNQRIEYGRNTPGRWVHLYQE